MAAFKAKQMKIRILCERAEKEEIEREYLEAQGLTEQQIDETIKMRKTQNFRTPQQTLPFDEKNKVIKNLHATNLGLTETHLAKSATKAMMEDVERKFAKAKAKKLAATQQIGLTQGQSGEGMKLFKTRTLEEQIKKEKKAALGQDQLNKLIKEQNFRDHINEMGQGMEAMSKVKASHYGETYVFTNDMQHECDTQNFDHHLRKNDLKWFSEAWVKYKGTMRK